MGLFYKSKWFKGFWIESLFQDDLWNKKLRKIFISKIILFTMELDIQNS